jgi:hypothetical protein
VSWDAAWARLVDLTWPSVLGHNIAMAALEELRVRAVIARIEELHP